MVWEKREGVWETETEEMEEDDRHWKKRNTASERKQTGKKEEGNVERGEKEKEMSSCPPAQPAREEEGTNPLTVFFPPPFWFWRGNCGAEVGCFSNIPCLSTSRELREWRLQGLGWPVPEPDSCSPFPRIFTPTGGPQLH